jgi:nitrogen fixation/metabolism regulation signal transduction histidine kinase
VRRPVPIGNEPLDLVGGRLVDREFIEALAALSGGPSALIDGSGAVVMRAEAAGAQGQPWVAEAVPLGGGGGWRVRISVPAGDVKEARQELLGVFASIAPFALVSALVVGIVLAEGISRPIRGLAARAEKISAAQSGPISLLPEKDEVHRLTISFDRMLDALSRSEQERVSAERIAAWQEVAKRIAHEVKNPLSPIKLAVENLRRTREKAPAELDRALEEETTTILEEVESLRRLVDEFSQFARLPAPQPASCDARQIVFQSLALFAARMEAAGVKVKLDTALAPERIEVDAEQIGRVVKNVIANALDALDPVTDRHLAISIRRAETLQRAWVEIEVRDSGVGFDARVQKRIFEPYFTTRPQRGGAGLGMAIAYRIVAEHGGTIQASGAPGRGATITIRLPMNDLRADSA